MTFYYLMRDVEPGAQCSYRPGRTYIDEVFRYQAEADRRAETYNRFCSCPGVRYTVLPHSDTECLPMDYFEPSKRLKGLETVLVG